MNDLTEVFIREARELLEDASAALLRLEGDPGARGDMDALFRAVHTIKGSSGVVPGVEPLTRVMHAGEDLLDSVRAGHLALVPGIVEQLLGVLDIVGTWIEALEAGGLPPDAEAESARRAAALRAALGGAGETAVAETAEEGFAPWPPDLDAGTASGLPAEALEELVAQAAEPALLLYRPSESCFFSGEDPFGLARRVPGLVSLSARLRPGPPDAPPDPFLCTVEFVILADAPKAELVDHFLYILSEVAMLPLRQDTTAPPARATPASATPHLGTPVPAAAPVERRARPRDLRVEAERIDTLMNLAGELVVAKNALAFLARKVEHELGQRAIGREIMDQQQALNRIADNIQANVLRIRMVPVGGVFGRFPRLVRDLARRLGKEIDLVIEGETTEVDKDVAEHLADPLVHIVRNSLDHGIEDPATRRRAGKPEKGTIRLSAHQSGERIIIEVSDDGGGIDPDRIRRKAVERGLVTGAEAAALPDEAALRLIFAPGFSTAETVTDLSGRGVGMDVVRTAIEGAGGTVSVESGIGRGSTIIISLPLAMTVSKVMVFRLGEQSFGMPMEHIRATLRVPRGSIHRVESRSVAVLREEVVPIADLGEILGVAHPPAGEWRQDLPVLLVQAGDTQCGLVVDGFEQPHDIVVKPLEGVVAACTSFSGSALLGDGRVLLVMNTREVLGCL